MPARPGISQSRKKIHNVFFNKRHEESSLHYTTAVILFCEKKTIGMECLNQPLPGSTLDTETIQYDRNLLVSIPSSYRGTDVCSICSVIVVLKILSERHGHLAANRTTTEAKELDRIPIHTTDRTNMNTICIENFRRRKFTKQQ
jgi:hypothetical protein